MGWMPAARRIESSRSVVARASSTDASRLRLGSVPFGSVRFGSFVRGTSSRSRSRRKVRNQIINRRAVRFVRVASRAWCVTHRV